MMAVVLDQAAGCCCDLRKQVLVRSEDDSPVDVDYKVSQIEVTSKSPSLLGMSFARREYDLVVLHDLY